MTSSRSTPLTKGLATAVLAVFTAASPINTNAEDLQILLPSPLPDSAPSGLGRDLLADPFTSGLAPGMFLTVGGVSAGEATIYRLIATDATSSEFTLEPVDYGLSGAYRLAHNLGDGLYAVGYSITTIGSKGRGQPTTTWTVRRSPSAGKGSLYAWEEDDRFNLTTASKGKTTIYSSVAYGVTSDASGNIYACGGASDGKVNHWIIRKKTSSGWIPTPVYDAAATDSDSHAHAICFVPTIEGKPAALFVVGIFNNQWTVLRSVDEGASWQSVGPWTEDGSLALPTDVACDSHGNIYVCGFRVRNGANRGWVVRKSSNGGDDWKTVLDQPTTNDSWAWRISIDDSDTISLAGNIDGANGSGRWAVVRNTPGQLWSESWTNAIFPFGPETSPISKGGGMLTDANGSMFLTGHVIDWTDPEDETYYSGIRVGLLRLVP